MGMKAMPRAAAIHGVAAAHREEEQGEEAGDQSEVERLDRGEGGEAGVFPGQPGVGGLVFVEKVAHFAGAVGEHGAQAHVVGERGVGCV